VSGYENYWSFEDVEFANNYVRNGIYEMPDICATPIRYVPTKDYSAQAEIDFAYHAAKEAKKLLKAKT
jgi:hypothetical protein